ncbi:hypothetical protein HII31_01298 [Pseudocercospora fuligena]|uniref:F-box domain-containing protein n=1 Tax=Pseudocercospora fuligena TaxID=685502 RepID=A0A8H6VM59_9PEZI|nr:hypothetical protein HII31_01298 [Pseudocercospora fuligena]
MTGQNNDRLIAFSTNLLASKIIHRLVRNPCLQQPQLSFNDRDSRQARSAASETSKPIMDLDLEAKTSATTTEVSAALSTMNISGSECKEKGSFPFMRLPVELRQQIFAHMFRQNDRFKIRVETAILRVSKQVHNDLLEVFEREVTAYIDVSVLRHRNKKHTIGDVDQEICSDARVSSLEDQGTPEASAEEILDAVQQRFSRIRNIRLNISLDDCRRCLSGTTPPPKESDRRRLTLADLVKRLQGARNWELTGWDTRLPGPDWDIDRGLIDLDLGHRDFAVLLPPEALPERAVMGIKDFTGWGKEYTEALTQLYNVSEKGECKKARV